MAATTLLTSDQFLALPDTAPPPPQQHDVVRSNILELLFGYTSACPGLRLKVLPSTAFAVGSGDVLAPDAGIVTLDRLNPNHKYIQGAPDLAIEVIAPTDLELDLRRNVDAYRSWGSSSGWIVYPESRCVQVCTQDSIREFKANQSITDPLLPGFSSPVSAFFELT